MKTLTLDIETYSSNDLKNGGVYKYVEADDFEILIIAYSIDEGAVTVLDLVEYTERMQEGDMTLDWAYETFMMALEDPNVKKKAWNANFERTCLAKYFGFEMPAREWSCDMVDATRIGLPASLGECAKVLGLDQQKDTAGTALINYFSKPCKPTKANGQRTRNYPEHDMAKWDDYKSYCGQDVNTELAIQKKLALFPVPKFEQALWTIDQEINDRGVLVDIPLMEGAVALDTIAKEKNLRAAKEITGLDNPNSPTQLLHWVNDNGFKLENMKAETIREAIPETVGIVKQALKIRQELSKTSVKKYTKMQDMACSDGRVRGVFQFYGAGTGRWAGRGVQLQNLTKHYISDTSLDIARQLIAAQDFDTLEMMFEESYTSLLSQLVRTCFIAKPGHEFAVSDFSAIEARVIAWYAGEKWRLEVFNTHGKIYEASAAQMFNIPITSIDKTTVEGAALRQKGKVAELALGYQGGKGALVSMGAIKMGVEEDELEGLVTAWRTANPNIVNFWYSVQRAAISTVKTGESNYSHGLTFRMHKGFLMIDLPSGRALSYCKPRIRQNSWGSDVIVFKGVNSTTRKWGDIDTYGGKLVENIVQATARDILATSLLRIRQAGYDTVMHIHDEIVVEVPENKGLLKDIEDLMSQPVKWAQGLPLGSDGFTSKFYMKD